MEQNHLIGKKSTDLLALLLFGAVLLFGGMYIPILGIFAVFLWCMPVILGVYRHGIGAGVVLAVLFVLLGFGMVGIPVSLVSVGCMSCLGLFYGISLRKKWAPGKTLFFGVVIGIVLGVLYFILVYMMEGVSLGDIHRTFEEELTAAYNVYLEAGVLDAALIEGMSVEAYFTQLVDEMMQILPSFFFLAALFVSSGNYLVAQFLMKKRSADIRPLPSFADWHLPWWILWGVVAALACYVGGNYFESEILLAIAKNILICSVPIFLVAGISLVRYFFVKWNVSAGIQIGFFLIALLFFSIALMFFILIGAGDAAIDYRSNLTKKKNNDVGGHTK